MISIDRVIAELHKLDLDQDNPMEDGRCVYTDQEGRHCIAGQVIEQLGGTLPRYQDVDNGRAIRDLARAGSVFGLSFDGDACELLASLQNEADYVSNMPPDKRAVAYPGIKAWRAAIDSNHGYYKGEF